MKILLTIIGWILIIWLSGSFIYSIQFHFKNYLRVQKNTKKGKYNKKFPKDYFNWNVIILFQIAKLIIVLVLLYFLLEL